MIPLTVGSLFSGIGGFELGLERTGGFKTVWQCEIDPFCQKVLEKHWPNVKRFTDIKKIGIEEEIPHVNVICGGFPCQPVSCAGKRKGKEDARWLWPEFYRVVRCVRPEWVLVENVPGLLSADSGRLFAGILRDLSESGYDAEWNIVSAASVGAPHLRKRVFIIAKMVHPMCGRRIHQESRSSPFQDSNGPDDRLSGKASVDVAHASREGLPQPEQEWEHGESAAQCSRRIFERRLGGTSNGISSGLDGPWSEGWEDGILRVVTGQKYRVNRLKALGNSIVPQCAQFVGQSLLDFIGAEA